MMNIEVLIALVYARPPLWDKKNKLRGDRNVIDKFWRQISIEMKDDENKLRKKWKYLRDQFSVELGKFPAGDDSYRPKWVHFDSLLFLKDMVKPRKLVKKQMHTVRRRQRQSSSDGSDQDVPDADSSADESQSEQDMSILELLDQGAPTKRKSVVVEDNGNSIVPAKKAKPFIAPVRETHDDENLFFFKSLLPHVRKIPENKVLLFRNRMQEIVEEFAYRSEQEDVKLF